MKLEKLSICDADSLYRLLHDAHKSNERMGIYFTTGSVSDYTVKQHIKRIPTFAYKDIKNNLVSTVSITLPWIDSEILPLPNISWFATNPEYKNQGFGRKIINDVVKAYVEDTLNAPAVTLNTAVNHPWLKEFYISLGFLPMFKVRLVSDHESIYMIKILNKYSLKEVSNGNIKKFLDMHNV